MIRYNFTRHENGEITSEVRGWSVTYPSTCNGEIRDLGFMASTGFGRSDFIHFHPETNEPYGCVMPKAVRERVAAMRRDFGPR